MFDLRSFLANNHSRGKFEQQGSRPAKQSRAQAAEVDFTLLGPRPAVGWCPLGSGTTSVAKFMAQ